MALLIFSYLQMLDFMSTLAFVLVGVREANPVVRFAFSIGATPVAGLMLVKVVAVLLGIWCWSSGRKRVLVTANLVFAFLVAWNLIAVIVGAADWRNTLFGRLSLKRHQPININNNCEQ